MDADIKKEFDDLKQYLREHMVVRAQFDDLKSFLREHMVTKTEFNDLKTEVVNQGVRLDQLTIAVDNLTKLTKDYYDEMAVLRHRVERMEKWIMQVAESTGVKYEA